MMGGRSHDTPERRGILSGQTGAKAGLIRCVCLDDGQIIPDIAEKLPGRGLWLDPDRAALEKAIEKGKFAGLAARALKAPVRPDQIDPGLPALIDRLLEKRALERLGLERAAGRLVLGYEKVRAQILAGDAAVLIAARDAQPDGVGKMQRLAGPDMALVNLFDRQQLSLALGRENVVHAALGFGTGSIKLMGTVRRLALFRGLDDPDPAADRQKQSEETQ